MTKVIFTFLIFLMSLTVTAQNNEINKNGIDITVSINKIPNNKGIVRFALYTKKDFLKTPILRETGTIENGKTKIIFKNVANNVYSIVCYHDVNENNILDFMPNGMPTEDIGVTNNVVRFGPPSFKDTKFTVHGKALNFEIKF